MAEQKEITNEQVDQMVAVVETAELLAESMGMKTSEAVRFLMKATQAFQKQGANSFPDLFTKRVQ